MDYDINTNEVFAVNSLGNSYAPLKALFDGLEVNEKEFKEAANYILA